MKRQMELSDESILVLGTLAYQEFTEAHNAVRTLEEREALKDPLILQGDGPLFFAEQTKRARERLEAARRTKDELAPYFAEALARNLTPR